jgi:hypothetical protein
MKTPPKEALADPQLMRGKIVALELLKILLENAEIFCLLCKKCKLCVQCKVLFASMLAKAVY